MNTGMHILMAEGLHLMDAEPTLDADSPRFAAELLEWRDVRLGLPDDSLTVLAWVKRSTETDWTSAFVDAGDWREAESGGLVDGQVLYWAQPEGPGA